MIKIIRVDKPYPEIVVHGDSYYQIKCIMDDYCGTMGELTAVTEYMYYAYICNNQNKKDLYVMFEGIAIAEMNHNRLLGEAIAKFGGNPVMGGNDKYWTGANIMYTQNIKEMLNNSIYLEQVTIANYQKAIACTKNTSLKELIARIIEDEQLHLEYFKKALSDCEC